MWAFSPGPTTATSFYTRANAERERDSICIGKYNGTEREEISIASGYITYIVDDDVMRRSSVLVYREKEYMEALCNCYY